MLHSLHRSSKASQEQEPTNESRHTDELYKIPPETPSLHGDNPPQTLSHCLSSHRSFPDASSPLTHSSAVPNLEQSENLPAINELDVIGEGLCILHAPNIMLQFGKARPKTRNALVSYQITRTLPSRIQGQSGRNAERAVLGNSSDS